VRIRTRLFLGFFLLTGAGFYFLVEWILDDLRPRYLESMEESLIDTANLLASLAEIDIDVSGIPADQFRDAFDRVARRPLQAKVYDVMKTKVDLRVYVTDSLGMVIFDSDGGRDEGKDYSRWRDVYMTLHGSYGARSTRVEPDKASSSELFVAAPIYSAGKVVGVLTVSKPSRSVDLYLHAATPKIIAAGALAALAVIALGLIISTLITHPILRLTGYARDVRDGKPVVLPALGRSEMGELGRAFDEMREALEGKKYVEQYVHTLTHELKSPISSVKGAAELLQEDMPPEKRAVFLSNIRSETDRMQQLVERMLDLSALESRRRLDGAEVVDVAALAAEARQRMEAALARKRITMEIDAAAGLAVKGEKFLLQQALLNLLDNAAAFSPQGGRIEVAAAREGGRVTVRVSDQGPGIPDFARERVFEKFYSLQRPDTGRKSSGLGLAIVQEITRLHGGEIRLDNRPEGGLRATWTLPATTPAVT
jgi:two-component system sensor histidine kinase CreC